MTKRLAITLLMAAGFLLWTSAFAWAAPSLGSIDGYMSNYEWSGAQTVEYGNSDGTWYDVEKLGLYIDDNMLYLGIQTDYHLDGGYSTDIKKYKYDEYGVKQSWGNWFIDPGDFAFDFNGDGSYEAGIDFNLSNGNFSFTFFEIDDPANWQNPKDHLQDSPYTAYVENYKTSQTSGDGGFDATIVYTDDNDLNPGDVLEAAINLDTLSAELNQLFTNSTTVNLFWTMECGNDALMVTENYSYSSPTPGNQVPEPTTMVLLGMGLLGFGAVKRKRYM